MDPRNGDVSERLAALESRVEAMEARVGPLDGQVSATRTRLELLVAELERPAPRVSAQPFTQFPAPRCGRSWRQARGSRRGPCQNQYNRGLCALG